MNKLSQAIQQNAVLTAVKEAIASVAGIQIAVGFIVFIYYQMGLYFGINETLQLFLVRVFQIYCTLLGFFFSFSIANRLSINTTQSLSVAIYSSFFTLPLLANSYVVEAPILMLFITPFIYSLYSRLIKLEFKLKYAPVAVAKSLSNALMNTIMLAFVLVSIFVFDGFILGMARSVIWICAILTHPIALLVIVLLVSLSWFKGIHGMDVIGRVARPFWFMMMLTNITAVLTGQSIPYIGSESFFQWAVFIGGSGCTIGLALLARFFSTTTDMKIVGKESWVPSIHNINEPIIFGVPIMDNPIFNLPFVLTPVICSLVSYIAFASGYVTAPSIAAPWVLPAPIGIFIATLGDFRSLGLMALLILISCIIYLPFFMHYERHLKNEARH